MESKRGQGNTFWIIIAAVIALVVLVVLLVIFGGKTGVISGGLLDCASKGGKCVMELEECPPGMEKTTVLNCPKEGSVSQECCLGVKEKEE